MGIALGIVRVDLGCSHTRIHSHTTKALKVLLPIKKVEKSFDFSTK